MNTKRTKECERIEGEIRQMLPDGVTVECQQDFDTKDYIIWLTGSSGDKRIQITIEEYSDPERNWKRRIQQSIQEP